MILGQLRIGARQAKNAPLASDLKYQSIGTQEGRQHCRLSICEYWLDKYSIRTKDLNNHSDIETGNLSTRGQRQSNSL